MKIVVTGASGLLGNAVLNTGIRRGHQLVATHHRQALAQQHPQISAYSADLSDSASVQRLILDHFPDAIVHCAAISNPADVLKQPPLAQRLNVDLPQELALLSQHINARFIHISSDMVFDGLQHTAYLPTDLPTPTSQYGQQKLAAEIAVLQAAADFSTVLRIPILTGNSPSEGRSVHEKLLHSIAQGDTPALFTDEMRQPTSAENVADLIIEILERQPLTGIFQWTGAETISRYQMGQALLDHFGLPHHLIAPSSIDDAPAAQTRPRSLQLDSRVLRSKLRTPALDFATQLEPLRIPTALREWYHAQ